MIIDVQDICRDLGEIVTWLALVDFQEPYDAIIINLIVFACFVSCTKVYISNVYLKK